jgi:hypothetical protein
MFEDILPFLILAELVVVGLAVIWMLWDLWQN